MSDDKGIKEVREALRTTFINGCMIAERATFDTLDGKDPAAVALGRKGGKAPAPRTDTKEVRTCPQ